MNINFNLKKSDFTQNYLYQKPYLFKSVVNTSDFSWKDVNQLFTASDFESENNLKLMNGYEVSKKEYVESYDNLGETHYRCITSKLYEYLRNGATLVRNRIKNIPFVDDISNQIGNYSEARTVCGAYAAFSSKSSYKSHWDTRDVYAVQLLGRKRWILKRPNFEFPLYMQQTKNFKNISEPDEVYMDIVLEAGDILYIPRGWWHDPLPLDGETFHLAVATFAPTGFEYMQWLQNTMPDILACRKNLTNYESDQENINIIGQQLSEIINDKRFYESFMIHHLLNHHVASPLSLDILGNGNVSRLNPNQKINLNANNLYLFQEGFVIINGSKINIDGISLDLIKYIYTNPNSTVSDVIKNFKNFDEDKINKIIFQLALENIIGLSL